MIEISKMALQVKALATKPELEPLSLHGGGELIPASCPVTAIITVHVVIFNYLIFQWAIIYKQQDRKNANSLPKDVLVFCGENILTISLLGAFINCFSHFLSLSFSFVMRESLPLVRNTFQTKPDISKLPTCTCQTVFLWK